MITLLNLNGLSSHSCTLVPSTSARFVQPRNLPPPTFQDAKSHSSIMNATHSFGSSPVAFPTRSYHSSLPIPSHPHPPISHTNRKQPTIPSPNPPWRLDKYSKVAGVLGHSAQVRSVETQWPRCGEQSIQHPLKHPSLIERERHLQNPITRSTAITYAVSTYKPSPPRLDSNTSLPSYPKTLNIIISNILH